MLPEASLVVESQLLLSLVGREHGAELVWLEVVVSGEAEAVDESERVAVGAVSVAEVLGGPVGREVRSKPDFVVDVVFGADHVVEADYIGKWLCSSASGRRRGGGGGRERFGAAREAAWGLALFGSRRRGWG